MAPLPDPPPPAAPVADIHAVAGVTVVRPLDKRILGNRVGMLFDDVLTPLAEGIGAGTLVLDFSRVAYFSSDSFGRLARLAATLGRGDGTLVLCHVAPGLREVFRVTRLDTTFEIVDDLASAIDGNRPTEPG